MRASALLCEQSLTLAFLGIGMNLSSLVSIAVFSKFAGSEIAQMGFHQPH